MKRYTSSLIILFFLVIYLIFPTKNSSIDAWYYAASIRHSGEIFHPHHLLYNATGSLFLKGSQIFGFTPDVLTFLKGLNAIFAVLCLIIIRRILLQLGKTREEIAGFLILSGSNFAIWRFATENETYILPLVFSLFASLSFIRYLKDRKISRIFISGAAGSLAILYHQIHFIWWLILLAGVVVYIKRWKAILCYFIPVILVPAIYSLVFILLRKEGEVGGTLIRFVLRDFYSGGVDLTFGWSNIYLTVINVIRSYIQVHGLMFSLVRNSLLFIIPAVIAAVLAGIGILQKGYSRKGLTKTSGPFIRIHVIIFIAHLIVAASAVGNAEFMVMLPILSFLILAALFDFKKQALYLVGLSLFIWNLSYGILPFWKADHSPHKLVIEWIKRHESDLFILMSDQHVMSKMYYLSGFEEFPNILKAPEIMVAKDRSLGFLHNKIDQYLDSGRSVFTDCVNRQGVITREQLLNKGMNAEFFSNYEVVAVDSITTLMGTFYLHKVLGKSGSPNANGK